MPIRQVFVHKILQSGITSFHPEFCLVHSNGISNQLLQVVAIQDELKSVEDGSTYVDQKDSRERKLQLMQNALKIREQKLLSVLGTGQEISQR